MSNPGIYVIEISTGVIKVGMSSDTDKRLATHLRNARGLGADPYRYTAIPCSPELLRVAESASHRVVRGMGGKVQAHTPEVFSGVYYNAVLIKVIDVVKLVHEFDNCVSQLAGENV